MFLGKADACGPINVNTTGYYWKQSPSQHGFTVSFKHVKLGQFRGSVAKSLGAQICFDVHCRIMRDTGRTVQVLLLLTNLATATLSAPLPAAPEREGACRMWSGGYSEYRNIHDHS